MSPATVGVNYELLPESLRAGAQRYVEHGIIADKSFLRSCFENDLIEAVCRADDANLPKILDIVHWLYNECPGKAHGSPEAVKAWIATWGTGGRP